MEDYSDGMGLKCTRIRVRLRNVAHCACTLAKGNSDNETAQVPKAF